MSRLETLYEKDKVLKFKVKEPCVLSQDMLVTNVLNGLHSAQLFIKL